MTPIIRMQQVIGYAACMESMASQDVTRNIGRVFERVFRGESILVTRYGRPYVLLCPPPEDPPAPAPEAPTSD